MDHNSKSILFSVLIMVVFKCTSACIFSDFLELQVFCLTHESVTFKNNIICAKYRKKRNNT